MVVDQHPSYQHYQTFKNVRQICYDVIVNNSKLDNCLKKLQELTSAKNENSSIVLNVLEGLNVELEFSNEDAKEKFREMCRKLIKILPEDILKVNLELFADETLPSRLVKTRTKLFYKQMKFNLLREESEGYAKLLVELNQEINSHFTSLIALDRVRCLIGQFNLDPNRVLDIILECFECRLEDHEFFIDLLRLFRANAPDICHILGFKFTFYQQQYAAYAGTDRKSGRQIYYLAALLIHHNLLDLLSLCCYLIPKSENMVHEIRKFMDESNKRQKKLGASSLALEKDATEGENAENRKDDIAENQKLSLLLALLDVGDWHYAKYLLDRMPEFYAVRYPEVAIAICRLIDRLVDTLYENLLPEYHQIRTSGGLSSKTAKLDKISDSSEEEFHLITPVKAVSNLKDLVEKVFPLANYLGPCVAHDPILYAKLIRLCVAFINEKSKNNSPEMETLFCSVLDLCDDVLVPALSLFKDNCALSEELWCLIKQFPYTTRYRFYGRWKNEYMKRHPSLLTIKGEVTGKTRYIMKRLSKETTKQAGRHIGKLCHNNPTVVFDYILDQIQQFENLIGPVVESLKFVTTLSYDVLSYCIIEHLSSPEKQKLKVSDATLSPWLISLAMFVGQVFKKYSIELTGVLQYVANQLKTGKSFDLRVLREIVQNMSGIETTASLTQEQLEASAGGDILRQEAGYFGQARNIKRSISRLKDALLQEDLVVSLCILMAQQRGSIVFKEGIGIHLKLVGQMLDQCQETLVQFASFLTMNLKSEDYVKHMPSAMELMLEYHVSPDAAMYLARPVYAHMINSTYDELKRADRVNKALTLERKTQHYRNAWNQVLTPLSVEVTKIYPATVWQDLNPQLFASFWTLSMYDVNVPNASYERELEKIRKSLQQIDDSRDPSDAKRKRDKEAKLLDELRRQREHVDRVMTRLSNEKDEWFLSKSQKGVSITQFLQLCLFPRCIYTDLDAIYCAKFLQMIHSLKTLNYSTLICYDKVFCEITHILASLSEHEANHYGRFLCATLEIVMRWHKDKETFDRECANYPGFVTRFRNIKASDGKPAAVLPSQDIVDYENFRHVVHKWHFKLTKAFLVSLGCKSYVPIRNSLLVLIKILPQYPVLKSFTEVISKKVNTLRDEEKDKRQDLHVLAISYSGALKQRKSPMLTDADFHDVQKDQQTPAVAKTAVSTSAAGSKPAVSHATAPTVAKATPVSSTMTSSTTRTKDVNSSSSKSAVPSSSSTANVAVPADHNNATPDGDVTVSASKFSLKRTNVAAAATGSHDQTKKVKIGEPAVSVATAPTATSSSSRTATMDVVKQKTPDVPTDGASKSKRENSNINVAGSGSSQEITKKPSKSGETTAAVIMATVSNNSAPVVVVKSSPTSASRAKDVSGKFAAVSSPSANVVVPADHNIASPADVDGGSKFSLKRTVASGGGSHDQTTKKAKTNESSVATASVSSPTPMTSSRSATDIAVVVSKQKTPDTEGARLSSGSSKSSTKIADGGNSQEMKKMKTADASSVAVAMSSSAARSTVDHHRSSRSDRSSSHRTSSKDRKPESRRSSRK